MRRIIKLTLLFSMCFTFLIFVSINTNTYAATGDSLSSFMGSTYDEDNCQSVISGTMDNIPNKFVPVEQEEAITNLQKLNRKSGYMYDSNSDSEGDAEYFDISYAESRIRYLFSSEDYHSSKVAWEGDGDSNGTVACNSDFENLTFIFSTKFTIAGTDSYLNIAMDITSGDTYYDGSESTTQYGIKNMYIMLDGTTLVRVLNYNLDYYYNSWLKVINKTYNVSTIYELITYGREHCIYILTGSTASVLVSNVGKVKNRSSLSNQYLKLNLAECYSGSNLTEYFEDDVEEVQSFTSTYISIFEEIFNSFYTFKAVNLQAPVAANDEFDITTEVYNHLSEDEIIEMFDISDNTSYKINILYVTCYDYDEEINYFEHPNTLGYYEISLQVIDEDHNVSWFCGFLRVIDEELPEIKWTTLYIIDIAEGQTLTKVEIKEFLLNSGQLEEE